MTSAWRVDTRGSQEHLRDPRLDPLARLDVVLDVVHEDVAELADSSQGEVAAAGPEL